MGSVRLINRQIEHKKECVVALSKDVKDLSLAKDLYKKESQLCGDKTCYTPKEKMYNKIMRDAIKSKIREINGLLDEILVLDKERLEENKKENE